MGAGKKQKKKSVCPLRPDQHCLSLDILLSTWDVATPNDRSPNAISQFPTTVGSTVGQHTQPQDGHWKCMWWPKTAVC